METVCLTLAFAIAQSQQVINTGSSFISTKSYDYSHEVIQCDEGAHCTISCGGLSTCYNTTIYCPTTSHKCSVSCIGVNACHYTDIGWIRENINTLNHNTTIDTTNTFDISYPPSTADNVPMTVNCADDYSCYGYVIQCPDNAECQVLCGGSNSCEHAVIHCPSTATCNVVCTGSTACQNANVLWSYHPLATSSLVCPTGGNQCNAIQAPYILNPTNDNDPYIFNCDVAKQCASSKINCPSNSKCIISCSNNYACAGAVINCGKNADCDIRCMGVDSCEYATFNGPIDHLLSVTCDENYACRGAKMYAQESSSFILMSSLNSYQSMRYSSIWVPPKTGNITNTKILSTGNNFNGYSGYEPIQLYAINGWLDLDIDNNPSKISYNNDGTMHCGENYTLSCLFAKYSWACSSANTNCDNPIVGSIAPTSTPTPDHTLQPTVNPSSNPTMNPTNALSMNSTQPTATQAPAGLEYYELDFTCIYQEHQSELIKHMSFKDYANLMNEVIVYAAELVFFQPLSFNDTNTCSDTCTNEYTPWIRAGITDFSLCHVFDVEIITPCPSYQEPDTDEDDIYIASGSFQIAAIQSVELYKDEMIDIFNSEKFLDSFTEQMNIKLSDYLSRRRLASWSGFTAIDVSVTDPNADTSTSGPTSAVIADTTATANPTTPSSPPSISEYLANDPQSIAAADTDNSINIESPIIIALMCTIILLILILIICGFLFRRKKSVQSDDRERQGYTKAQSLEMHVKDAQLGVERIESQKGTKVSISEQNKLMQPVSQITQPALTEEQGVTKGGYISADASDDDSALEDNLPLPNSDDKE